MKFFAPLALASIAVAAPVLAEDAPPAAGPYSQQVLTSVSSHLVYPRIAKARGEQGVVTLAIVIDKAGAVTNVAVVNSSGVSSLDEAAMTAAREAAPFPAQSATSTVQGKIRFSP